MDNEQRNPVIGQAYALCAFASILVVSFGFRWMTKLPSTGLEAGLFLVGLAAFILFFVGWLSNKAVYQYLGSPGAGMAGISLILLVVVTLGGCVALLWCPYGAVINWVTWILASVSGLFTWFCGS